MTVALATPPEWVRYRGGDCRAFDRTSRREVYGPGHAFGKTTDLLLTNGEIRFWVGNRGLIPFLNVQAVDDGEWHQDGVVALAADGSPDVLIGSPYLVDVTPDFATAALTIKNLGEVFITIIRGVRALFIQHGSDRFPVAGERFARWLGAPPARVLSNTTGAGKFGAGHRQVEGDDVSEFLWPRDVDKTEWTVAYWWLPNAASSTLASSGLASIWDTDDELAVHGRFDTTDNKAKLTIGATTLASSALTFAANDPVFVVARLSPDHGVGLSVKTPTAALEHVKNAATAVGTLVDYDFLSFATSGPGTWGGGTWGMGTWGGVINSRAVIDNLMIYGAYLSDAAIAALAAAASPLAGVGDNEGALVWYAPFDTLPVVPPAPLTTGRVVEAAAEADGFKRVVAGLSGVTVVDFGLGAIADRVDFAAGLLSDDTAADLHSEFASAHQEEVRVR